MAAPRTLAILGAGCAGTLLARELRRQRFPGRIELLDLRVDFQGEQRWCFWRDRQASSPDVPISHEWLTWQVRDHGQEVMRSSRRYAYSHVHAPQFFTEFHARLQDDPAVGLRLGCRVDSVSPWPEGGYRIVTSQGELTVDEVIDARHAGATAYRETLAGAVPLLWQSFVGQVVEYATPCFDPAAVTLMDFRVPFVGGLAFGYLLPFSSTRALVEVAVLAVERPTPSRLLELLAGYLAKRGDQPSKVLGTEWGTLPMTTANFAPRIPSGIAAIGVGGGAARPSSGYALGRILRSTPPLAAAILRGETLAQPPLAPKYRVLDSLFLRLLRDDPAAARRAFLAMFSGVPADRLTRFLTESSGLLDDLWLGWVLPKIAFVNILRTRSESGCGLQPGQGSVNERAPERFDQSNAEPASQLLSGRHMSEHR